MVTTYRRLKSCQQQVDFGIFSQTKKCMECCLKRVTWIITIAQFVQMFAILQKKNKEEEKRNHIVHWVSQ